MLFSFFSLLPRSAGSRDAALTAHGVLQTRRLGAHLVAMPAAAGSSESIVVTHIFSSDLQRASATASAVLDAQHKRDAEHGAAAKAAEVVQSADLRERDFRSGEGMRFRAASAGRNAFADAESWDDMSVRAKRFIDDHLHPHLGGGGGGGVDAGEDEDRRAIVVVAHGMILDVLLSLLLLRYAPAEFARMQPPAGAGTGVSDRRQRQLHVPWSNTGYLVLNACQGGQKPSGSGEDAADVHVAGGLSLQVTAVNCTAHLDGLKKTRGGIGSARFDPKQKTMDAFFGPAAKRQKRGGDA